MSDPVDVTLPRRPPARARRGEGPVYHLRAVWGETLPADASVKDELLVLDGAHRALVIGRAPDEPHRLAMPWDDWASRAHTKVTLLRMPGGDDTLMVEDLGSTNGTYVDGEVIAGPTRVGEGQVVRVGATVFVVGRTPLEERAAILAGPAPPEGFLARSFAMVRLWGRLVAVAAKDEGALLLGELGTGKTRLAQIIHELSGRARGPFVPLNCSAIPLNLEEATLFGVVAGFIPGVKARSGLIAQADGGTLFLDEFADLTQPAQAKLLDAFDPNAPSYLPVGGTKRVDTRCRLVLASNRDVYALVAQGVIRHDLTSRLVVAQLTVPPLRERREDVIPLFEQALARFAPERAAADVIGHVEVAEELLLGRWTENVRGLESLARRVGLGEELTADMVREHAGRGLAAASDGRAPGGGLVVPGSAAGGDAGGADVVTPALSDEPIWPPRPEELLELLAEVDFSVTAVAERLGRARETVGRLVQKMFGPGGKGAAKRAVRVWRASGRVPGAEEIDAAYVLYFETSGPGVAEARARWERDGELG